MQERHGGFGFARRAVDGFAHGLRVHVAHLLADELQLSALRSEGAHAAEFENLNKHVFREIDALELIVAEFRHLLAEILQFELFAFQLRFGRASIAVFRFVVFVVVGVLTHGRHRSFRKVQGFETPYDNEFPRSLGGRVARPFRGDGARSERGSEVSFIEYAPQSFQS